MRRNSGLSFDCHALTFNPSPCGPPNVIKWILHCGARFQRAPVNFSSPSRVSRALPAKNRQRHDKIVRHAGFQRSGFLVSIVSLPL
jgi:hypothetical protein